MSISEFQDPVVGEDERAFLGDQFRHVLERLAAVVLEPDPVTASWVR